MKENKIKIIINKSVKEVFEFTTNPKNTPLWISSIKEEVAEEYPPKINTKYKNRGDNNKWNFYKVIELKNHKLFILSNLKENYYVRYKYKKLDDNKTEMEYFEWVKEGELENPFTEEVLNKLKSVMDK